MSKRIDLFNPDQSVPEFLRQRSIHEKWTSDNTSLHRSLESQFKVSNNNQNNSVDAIKHYVQNLCNAAYSMLSNGTNWLLNLAPHSEVEHTDNTIKDSTVTTMGDNFGCDDVSQID